MMIKIPTLIKTNQEIERMRKACAISDQLHLLAMATKCDGLSEILLGEKIQRAFQATNSDAWAYPLILGSGERATILHAAPSKRILAKGYLLLMDAGVQFEEMASDITRTWPVGNKFTPAQRKIYSIVLKTQKEVIKRVHPGQNLSDLHKVCQEYLLEGLLYHGIIKGKNVAPFFPHKTSHWIGHLVHDQCPYFYQDKSPVQLAPGMCFTVEPGLYFKETYRSHLAKDQQDAFMDIGVRIEDVVLVTKNGSEVLTHAPKEIEEIENLRAWAIK